jgi:hypothetical protein
MLPKTAWGIKLGHRRDVRCMTALPPKAEVHPRSCYVANVLIAARTQCSKKSLLNHLVGASEQLGRHVEAERLRSLEINHQLI